MGVRRPQLSAFCHPDAVTLKQTPSFLWPQFPHCLVRGSAVLITKMYLRDWILSSRLTCSLGQELLCPCDTMMPVKCLLPGDRGSQGPVPPVLLGLSLQHLPAEVEGPGTPLRGIKLRVQVLFSVGLQVLCL